MFQKIAAAGLVVGGLGLMATGGYLVMSGDGGSRSGDPLLAHAPADSVMFFGYTDTSLPLRDINTLWGQASSLNEASASDPSARASEGGPAAGILTGLVNSYRASLAADDRFLGRLGAMDQDGMGMYMVGAMPVLRLSIQNPDSFWQEIDRIESRAGVSADSHQRDSGARTRRYRMGDGGDERPDELVVATHDGDAMVTLVGPGIDDQSLALALGERQPDTSLADTGQLRSVAGTHGLLAGAAGFIDHQRLVGGLTGASGNRLGEMLGEIRRAQQDSEASESLETARTAACRKDARAIAGQWPHTAFGLTEVASEQRRLGARLAVAGQDDDAMKALQGLRGHIPKATNEQTVLEIGLGLNSQDLVPTLQDLAQRFTNADFECQALQQAQEQVAELPIGQFGMVTAMIGDVRGVSAALMAVEPGGAGPVPATGDAVVEVATPEPEALWQAASSSLGVSTQGPLEKGGAPVGVKTQLPLPPDVRLRVALRENALVVLTGDAEPGDAAGESNLDPNGLLSVSYDYAELAQAAEASGAARMGGAEAAQTIKAFQGLDARYNMRMDAQADDLRLDAGIQAASND